MAKICSAGVYAPPPESSAQDPSLDRVKMSSKPNYLEVEVVSLLLWWWLTYLDLFRPMLTHADQSCPCLS